MANVYRAPGVISSEVELSGASALLGGVEVLGIVGAGFNYILIEDSAQTKGSASGTDTIKNSDGTNTATGEVLSVSAVGSLPGLADYDLTTDYLVVDNTIVWTPAGDEPSTGSAYYVTFKKAKAASYYEPIRYYDIDDVRNIVGSELYNGQIQSATLVAYLAFQAGASSVIVCQQQSNSYSDFTSAVDKMKKEEVDLIAAPGITQGSAWVNYLINHCDQMSTSLEAKERMTFIGASLFDTSTTIQVAEATAVANEKVAYLSPPSVRVFLHDEYTGEDKTLEVSSLYAAGSISGRSINPNFDPAEPLLRKAVVGINGVTNYLRSEADYLGGNGIMVLYQDGTLVKIRHDVTTNVTSSKKNTWTIPRIKFYVLKKWRKMLDGYIGSKILPGITTSILNSSTSFLNEMKRNGILVDYRNVKVTQDSVEPRRIYVYGEIAPIWPLTWLNIEFGLYTQVV